MPHCIGGHGFHAPLPAAGRLFFVFCKQYDKKEGKHIGQRKPEYLKLICPCSCDYMQEAADNIIKKMLEDTCPESTGERDAQAPCKARDTGGEEIAGAEKQRRGNCQAALPVPYNNRNQMPDAKKQRLEQVGIFYGKGAAAQLVEKPSEKAFLRQYIYDISDRKSVV